MWSFIRETYLSLSVNAENGQSVSNSATDVIFGAIEASTCVRQGTEQKDVDVMKSVTLCGSKQSAISQVSMSGTGNGVRPPLIFSGGTIVLQQSLLYLDFQSLCLCRLTCSRMSREVHQWAVQLVRYLKKCGVGPEGGWLIHACQAHQPSTAAAAAPKYTGTSIEPLRMLRNLLEDRIVIVHSEGSIVFNATALAQRDYRRVILRMPPLRCSRLLSNMLLTEHKSGVGGRGRRVFAFGGECPDTRPLEVDNTIHMFDPAVSREWEDHKLPHDSFALAHSPPARASVSRNAVLVHQGYVYSCGGRRTDVQSSGSNPQSQPWPQVPGVGTGTGTGGPSTWVTLSSFSRCSIESLNLYRDLQSLTAEKLRAPESSSESSSSSSSSSSTAAAAAGAGAAAAAAAARSSGVSQLPLWEALPDMPTGRYGHACCIWHNYLVVAGGNSQSRPLNSVDAFNLVTGQWEVSGMFMPPMRQHRFLLQLYCVRGQLLAVGGDSQNSIERLAISPLESGTEAGTEAEVGVGVGHAAAVPASLAVYARANGWGEDGTGQLQWQWANVSALPPAVFSPMHSIGAITACVGSRIFFFGVHRADRPLPTPATPNSFPESRGWDCYEVDADSWLSTQTASSPSAVGLGWGMHTLIDAFSAIFADPDPYITLPHGVRWGSTLTIPRMPFR